MKLFGQCPTHESGGLQLVSRWVQLSGDHPVGRGQAPLYGPLLEPSGQSVGQQAFGPEPAEYRRGRECGEVPQRFQAQATQEVHKADEIAASEAGGSEAGGSGGTQSGQAPKAQNEHTQGQGGKKFGAPTFRHDNRLPRPRPPSRHPSSKEAVGNTHPAAASPVSESSSSASASASTGDCASTGD
jgi:hypothetical protein